ncbi:MAG: dienelactone hydrolase family protein [Syntrophobacteraceae bacterium]
MRSTMFLIVLAIGFASTVEAKVVGSMVPYRHEGVELAGYLAYDDSIEGRRPGVLLVHEWWGLNDYAQTRANQLAGLGYVAFAADMYGKGKVTENPREASEWAQALRGDIGLLRQRATAALEVLKADPRTDAARIAAIGYCFGGGTVQHLAYSGAPLKGIVSFHGGFVNLSGDEAKAVKAKILICHGAADTFSTPLAMQDYIAAMEKGGLDWQMVILGGAKHAFTNPNADKTGLEGIAYSKSADERSWKYMKDFFDEIFH